MCVDEGNGFGAAETVMCRINHWYRQRPPTAMMIIFLGRAAALVVTPVQVILSIPQMLQ